MGRRPIATALAWIGRTAAFRDEPRVTKETLCLSFRPAPPHLEQLKQIAKDRLREARAEDPEALRWFHAGRDRVERPTLAGAHLRLARDYGFSSWAALHVEVSRRLLLELRDPEALARFIGERPELATFDLMNWRDHRLGASPLGFVAMSRYDTSSRRWRDVAGNGAMANVLIAAGAPIDGQPGDRETPLVTAASSETWMSLLR